MQLSLEHVEFRGRPAGRARSHSPATQTSGGGRQDPSSPDGRDIAFARFVLRHAGLRPDSYRSRPLARRTPACLRAIGAHTEVEGRIALAAVPTAEAQALNALLIGVTEFFRDADVFDALARVAVPALAPSGRSIRAWAAGCASGAEVYSLAMLLSEAGQLDRSWLVGTDFREDAIRSAREAVFEETYLSGVDPSRRSTYFDLQSDGTWRVSEALRRRTAFRAADLTCEVEVGPWDLVLWRNVAIYLTRETADRVAERIVEQIVPGGFLVVGRAERPFSRLPLRRVARSLYQKTGYGA